MNPNHGYSQGFYGQTGSNFGGGPGGPGGHGYPGSMSPYAGAHGGPMSPYSGGQGQSPNSSQSMYANQNSQYNNQSQGGSPYPGSGGAGGYPSPSGGFHPHQSMQSYYNNHSPTHQHHFPPFGGGGPHLAVRHPADQGGPRGPTPHPMGLMMGARIPHPMNSPNQNVTGNQIKTENLDLKVGGTIYAAAVGGGGQSQGYNQSGFGFNGYGAGGGGGGGAGNGVSAPRPTLSPNQSLSLSVRSAAVDDARLSTSSVYAAVSNHLNLFHVLQK